MEAHQAGRLQDAACLYQAILQVQPRHGEANHSLGMLAMLGGQAEMALAFLKTALEANPGHGPYWLSYIDALIKAGHRDYAGQVLRLGRQLGLSGAAVDGLEGKLAPPVAIAPPGGDGPLPAMVMETASGLIQKKMGLLQAGAAIKTLVLGSSHGDYGFDPAFCPGSFNLCSTSQDMKHSQLLYEYAAQHCPQLQNVVVFHSVFSPGFMLEKCSEKLRCAAFKEIFELPGGYDDEIETAYAMAHGRLAAETIPPGFNGFLKSDQRFFFSPTYGAERRAGDHLKNNRRDGATAYLGNIIDRARQWGHHVLVLIPPGRSDYKQALRLDQEELFGALFTLVSGQGAGSPVKILDLYHGTEFRDEDFGDYDHLRPAGQGPERLAQLAGAALA